MQSGTLHSVFAIRSVVMSWPEGEKLRVSHNADLKVYIYRERCTHHLLQEWEQQNVENLWL
ncbi:hypothetical protein [Anabaena lutea]|uniref:hypothetical protein n=1 Tax=Anabaena lutea TaxID=212350 RepID=UPI0016893F60|nr:hypothetical protein [Anabaena lutea]